jgi:anaerobic magnesium-protoporphyrin IX monomethyl ester cyclase
LVWGRHLKNKIGEAFPDAIIIAGGESVTALPEFWLSQSKHLKVCVLGEGEETIIELLSAIENKKNLSEVQEITFREGDRIITTHRRKRIREIEEIPLPAWDLFPVESYNDHKIKWGVTERKSLPLMATRGCPYDCTFCSSPQMWGKRYSMRTAKHVADEMEL